jgi:hypothetical protein
MATFPSDPSFESINFKINTPLIKTQTNSGKITRVAMGHQYYSFTVNYPNLTARELGTVSGFISLTLGGYSAFQIVLPELSYTKSENPSDSGLTFTTSATTSSGSLSVAYSVSGSSTANKEFFAAGDFIKFSNHDKVYQVTQTTSTNGSSVGTLVIGGALINDVPSGSTITRNAVPFTVILDSDAQEFDTGMGGISSLKLDMREVW